MSGFLSSLWLILIGCFLFCRRILIGWFFSYIYSVFCSTGNAEDDEPDKIAIAFGRFGRFKRFIVGSVKGFFLFIKNKIVELVSGRRGRYDEDTFEVDEKVTN